MLPPRFQFPPSHRLRASGDFAAVFAARQRQSRGVMTLHARPNNLDHNRLGISIGRRHGNAVRRNAIKRRLREAFRLNQHQWPRGYDLAVTFRPHRPLSVVDYAEALAALLCQADAIWRHRGRDRT